jgi:IS605 OrfB family transposase
MKLTAQVKLQPMPEQADALKRTMEAANAAANHVSEVAWQAHVFGKIDLQKLTYSFVRSQFAVAAQVVIRLLSKVADAYKLDKKSKRTFKPHGAIAYDMRILRWFVDEHQVSIWTVDGRQKLPFVCGDYQAALLQGQRGESDLVYRDGEFYLLAVCDVDETPTQEVDDYLGVDLGIANIAVDSDRTIHQGKTVKRVRYQHRQLRRKLQAKGTHSTRRRLQKLSGKERRFATWTNHHISKSIVEKAKDTQRGIALEDLGGIRDGVTVRKAQRSTLHSWSFHQLRGFIEYKAKRAGVPVVAVNPRNTSRTCPCCGYVDKANRKTQDKFLCMDCGFSGLADHIAAINIGRRAVVNQPNVPTIDIEFRQ